jgi:hypothetical protein
MDPARIIKSLCGVESESVLQMKGEQWTEYGGVRMTIFQASGATWLALLCKTNLRSSIAFSSYSSFQEGFSCSY